ncbi:energy-coupling factor transporter transmembrane protein EcfT [Demequina sp. NBRC 110051]|uniref:energy-coupling factor transporter transmembrane component T family protein n=1 Tax=Demequina sp. NBRC 110051 TaxID=1570340 RepID=UPI0009FBD206|nr:energy-coupling factor transporter transmembrane component T [Demequina sp. NBRC 110051]
MITPTGLYRARETPLHHTPAWFKVALLLAATVAVIMLDDPISSLGIMAACLLLLASTQPPARTTVIAMAGTLVVAALTASIHLWRGDWWRAVDVTADLVAVVALALAVAASTSMTAMLDFVSVMARPLRAVLPPETLGLMFAMMLRALPEVAEIYLESRQAARARGFDRNIRAIVYPTTTRTVGFALDLGQAIHARGIGEEGDQVDAEPETAPGTAKRSGRRSRRRDRAAS